MKFDLSLIPPHPDFHFEKKLWSAGYERIGGIDEAGRGALAGPVAAAIVVFPPNLFLEKQLDGVNDSKLMSASSREEWAIKIKNLCMNFEVSVACADEIDSLGINKATRLAMERAIKSLAEPPQYLLLDYISLPEISIPQIALVKGDRRSLSIAAASILAKTARDDIMRELDQDHPGYGFNLHKGYGTAAHRSALAKLGLSPVHRRSFRLLKPISAVENQNDRDYDC